MCTSRTGPHAGVFGVLTSDEVSLLQGVIDELGRHSATVLRNLSYQTWPIREARSRGVELDHRECQNEKSRPRAFVPDLSAPPSEKIAPTWIGDPG